MKASSQFRKFLPQVAFEAGQVLLKYYEKVHRIEVKKNAGIVTEADKKSEQLILEKIFRKFPKSSIIAEESGESRGESSLCWIIDPLDGTSNYAHGFPMFCVSIGVYEDDKPKAGVVYHPVMREMFYAEKGCGSELNGKQIKVSSTNRLNKALLGTGFYYSKGKELRKQMEIFLRMNQTALAVRRPGAAALDLAYVASGRYDGFWERGLAPWDVAAGFLLVTEAGGKISDYTGKPTDIFRREAVASNSKMHSQMIQILK